MRGRPADRAHRQGEVVPAQLAHDGLGALQLAELVEHEPQPRLHLLVRVQRDPAPRRLGQPRRQRHAQLAARRLLPLALVQAHPDLVQLRLAHEAGQAQEQAVVVGAGVVEALAVADDDAEHRAQLQQLVPVAVVAGQARGVQAQRQLAPQKPRFDEGHDIILPHRTHRHAQPEFLAATPECRRIEQIKVALVQFRKSDNLIDRTESRS